MMKKSTRERIAGTDENIVFLKPRCGDASDEPQQTMFYIPREEVAKILLDVFPEGITLPFANNR